MARESTPVQRCAIYTRKSSREGLEQEFNSLHAQREAAMAYILSQQHEGWLPVDDHYDDGGCSGGNMDRPGLQRLMKDIESNKVDTVVVYKIDRLTRSLTDFARLVEFFDDHQVSFVAVTQQFNTTSSMGRLTLNILLSFAQFEREMTGERIRDKVAMSKQKGKWMGGVPPLGYLAHQQKLKVHPDEAAIVEKAFSYFLETGSALKTIHRLNDEGYRTRIMNNRDGQQRGGQKFTTTYLYKLLHNRTYLGETGHKGQWFRGEHPAIISSHLWQKVHTALSQGAAQRRREQEWKNGAAMLKGVLEDEQGIALVATHTRKRGKLHRYYVSNKAIKEGYSQLTIPPIPAETIEGIVSETLQDLIITPEIRYQTWQLIQDSDTAIDEQQVTSGLTSLGEIWPELFPEEQARLIRLMVERIVVTEQSLEMELHSEGVLEAAMELSQEGNR